MRALLVVVLGGAKVTDKLGVMRRFADGGADTYTTWADWVSYIQALTGLSAPEELLIASARVTATGNSFATACGAPTRTGMWNNPWTDWSLPGPVWTQVQTSRTDTPSYSRTPWNGSMSQGSVLLHYATGPEAPSRFKVASMSMPRFSPLPSSSALMFSDACAVSLPVASRETAPSSKL